MRWPLIFVWLLMAGTTLRAASLADVSQWVVDGHWEAARAEIGRELAATNLSFPAREALLFQSDRMRRMSLDFDHSREQAFQQAQTLAPSLTQDQFAAWENAGAVEFLDIDGSRRYFGQAGKNLFFIIPDARALLTKEQQESLFGPPNYQVSDIHAVFTDHAKTGKILATPRTWHVTYQLSVNADAVPDGETIRAWLPFPHPLNRQSDIRLISTDPSQFVMAATNASLTSVYLEKRAVRGRATVFQIEFECTCSAFYEPIDPARVAPVNPHDPALAPFLAEQTAQIVFSGEIKNLAARIVGAETNPYLKARRTFQWVYEHVPWASMREYSTVDCLPHYAITQGHGDCGTEAMTFMALCRASGIPARWESGWVTAPTPDMHDWCEIYLAPYGWVPVDVCYGLVDSEVDREKWFYLGGIDAYRFAVNTGFGQPLYPAKTYFRSEIVDFQRGEVEWRGGNLYFDQWSYHFQVKEVPPTK
jgi:transglutaminase-like putative cysteine protease